MAKAVTSVVDYQAIQRERLTEIQRSITDRMQRAKDFGGLGDTLRFLVLSRVAQGNYDEARGEINAFIESNWRYPTFQRHVERYRRYSQDLVNAIEAKRSFPGLAQLPLAKQQELYESVIEHFDDLKANLKVIERVEKESKLNDIRSTVYVVRAAAYSAMFVFCFAFIMAMKTGLGASLYNVYGALVKDLSGPLFQILGL